MSLYESRFRSDRSVRSIGWQTQLHEARHPHDVLAIARDFLAQVSPEEISQLPVECRPDRLVDEDDVSGYALMLARAQSHTDSGSEPEVLHKLCAFFADASTRLSQIFAPSSND